MNATPDETTGDAEAAARKYTRVDHARLAELLADGSSPSDAARVLDVDRSTVYRALESPEYARELALAAAAIDATVDVGTIGGLQVVASWLRDRILAPLSLDPAEADDPDEQMHRAKVRKLEGSTRAQYAAAFAKVCESITRAQERRDALRSRAGKTTIPAQSSARGLQRSA